MPHHLLQPIAATLRSGLTNLPSAGDPSYFRRGFLTQSGLMFTRLKQKWGVTPWQLFWILWVFAITGTTTAWITGKITSWAGFDDATWWGWRALLRLGMLVFGYQAILLTVAFLLGQFPFFWRFEKKLLQRLHLIKKDKDPLNKENQQLL